MIENMFWVNIALSMGLAMWYGFVGNPYERVAARMYIVVHVCVAAIMYLTKGY